MAAGISQSDWPFNNRAVNGSKLSTSLAHNFDPTAIAKEQPRNKSAEVKGVALINSRRSRRIVTISSLLRMAFGLTQAVCYLEQRSIATVKYVFRFIASCLGIFI